MSQCDCVGELEWVHEECLKRFITSQCRRSDVPYRNKCRCPRCHSIYRCTRQSPTFNFITEHSMSVLLFDAVFLVFSAVALDIGISMGRSNVVLSVIKYFIVKFGLMNLFGVSVCTILFVVLSIVNRFADVLGLVHIVIDDADLREWPVEDEEDGEED